MNRLLLICALCTIPAFAAAADTKPPVYVWFEPEWFEEVSGEFGYWGGETKPMGTWGIAGPGISAEWTQGGESEWNSMGASKDETKAYCHRDFIIPRAGKYKVWVRYYDHRNKTEPFKVVISQGGQPKIKGELGVEPIVSPNEEYQLYWGFTFAWASLEGELQKGPAKLEFIIDRAGEAFRQVDIALITDDLALVPQGREKPHFNYLDSFYREPGGFDYVPTKWRGAGGQFQSGAGLPRVPVAGKDFSMWTGIGIDPKWWNEQKVESLTKYDLLFHYSPPHDIKADFHKQFAGRRDVPFMSWPNMNPGFHLRDVPDLSPDKPLRKWLEKTKTPFFITTNYANPTYPQPAGKATYEALTGPLADQFLGYIHGEVLGTPGVTHFYPKQKTRREHVDGMGKGWRTGQKAAWSKIYGTDVAEDHRSKSISCMAIDNGSLAHILHESGSKIVGYELDCTNVHIPMRIAFQRGAARQYGESWINYASGNFGDACNYFTQDPRVPRGARGWWHSKYAVTDGVTASWYRKMYYMNYFGGASAIYWEQDMENQWLKPGPPNPSTGKPHPIQFSPYGRATEDFIACVDRVPDRGEPVTPIGILLSYGHGYDRVSNYCVMLNAFKESRDDIQLRELFNVLWYPSGVLEGLPAAPDVQSMPSGHFGNIFDILVDRPSRAKAILDYPVIWAAGDVDLTGSWLPVLREYLNKGGTLVINSTVAGQLPADLLGLRLTGKSSTFDKWSTNNAFQGERTGSRDAIPFDVEGVELKGATPVAWAGTDTPLITRHAVGSGAVIVTLVPHLVGQDERAHPVIPELATMLSAGLLPVEVRLPNGNRPDGEIAYQVNKTKTGYIVLLTNNRGIDKTQHGIARVDRTKVSEIVIVTKEKISSAKEQVLVKELPLTVDAAGRTRIQVRVPPGDVHVISLTTK